MAAEEKKERRIESIWVVPSKDVPKEVRLNEGLDSEKGFIEVRVERENPAYTSLNFMKNDTPGRKFSRLLKEANIKL